MGSSGETVYNSVFNQPFFRGYDQSSYIWDWFGDQVALAGGDHMRALRELAATADDEVGANAVTRQWLGITFVEMLSRARLALLFDDHREFSGLPAWTQFHHIDNRIRAYTVVEPVRFTPGSPAATAMSLLPGTGWAALIDGAAATGDALYTLAVNREPQTVLSVVRLK